MDFYNTFKPSYQSVFSLGPDLTPNPIYYGLLFSILALNGVS